MKTARHSLLIAKFALIVTAFFLSLFSIVSCSRCTGGAAVCGDKTGIATTAEGSWDGSRWDSTRWRK